MKNKIITIIVFVLNIVLLAGIVWSVNVVMTDSNGEQDIMAERTMEWRTEGIMGEITETAAELTTKLAAAITTERVTEVVTEELKVEDDVAAPIFLTFANTVEVKQGAEFDIHDYVGYGDDVDRTPELIVEGEVDTSVLGTYPLTLTLTDEAGHSTSESMNVNVVSEITPYSGGEKEAFDTFAANYKRDDTVLGIDVSRWQEDIDFGQVKNAGCDFVIIRIGGYDDGSQYEDRYYKTNIQNAKAAGLKVGIYWHAEESSVEEIKSNVAYMMGILAGEKLDFPIAYDWEDFSGFEKYEMNLHDINTCFETFCNEVEAYGYEACLYSSKNFLEKVWTNEKEHLVWLANYTAQTTYAGKYYMWQQGNTGRIAGISTDVDFNVWYTGR
ncbi:MAG: DUF5011 domain-containing protein [Lachnospiraceae bacterium]|nr:DUF5011 domain-containing protein [Lachnospiraceae bacterium]